MKFILIAFAVLAAVAADVNELPSNEYLPPVPAVAPTQEYLPPVSVPVEAEPAHDLAQDGYRYKTVKRYRLRHRRDVNELPSNEYLPPVEAAPIQEPIALPAPVEAEPAHELANDGYRYKTVKRYRFRHRRDVNELPSNEYLPPVPAPAPLPTQEYLPPVSAPVEAAPAHDLAQDGYRYKTVKRYRLRHRRDVNELPSNEYLPPVDAAPIQEPIALPAPVEAEPAHELANDGYRYKTVKRYRFRHRRDVNELPSNEYLPPVEAVAVQEAVVGPAPVEAEPAHELANDGYRYKTVKRYRLRHRRDVNELPSNEYLPPVAAPAPIAAPLPTQEYLPPVSAPVEAAPAHDLAQDGYRYKTVKRYRLRHRRDVNELPSNEYLPPVDAAPIQEPIALPAPVEAEPAHELANDGYRYKTVKRYRFRHRRDVNELPSNEYLPPVEAVAVQEGVVGPAPVEAEPAHELANDGYRYKTVKRYRLRHRRDVNELPSNEYLPPVPAPAPLPTQEYLPPVSAPVEAAPAHDLAQDGYRYKTVKRYRLRHRRDVNELPSNEYLPPVEAVAVQEAVVGPAPVEAEPAHELANDGYRYKTVKRYRLRHRRDVNELPSNEYLPPVPAPAPIPAPVPTQEYLPPVSAPVAVAPAHDLAQDGYRYKTVKRFRLRHRA